jgi:magnesium transporter
MRSISPLEQSDIFQELSPHVQQSLLKQLSDNEIVDLVDYLDPRQASNVLSRIKDDKRRLKIIKKIKTEVRDKIEYFLRFHPKATTSLISFNYVLLPIKATIGDAAEAIEEHYEDTGTFPEVLVQEKGQVVGEVSMAALVRNRNSAKLKNFVKSIETITYQAEVLDIVNALTTSKRKKVVVLDHDESVLGLVYADDALSLFGKMPAESLYHSSGVDEGERPFDSAEKKFKSRYRWLILNLLTCFGAAAVIYLFADTLEELVILSVYIPIVAGMGSNAGSQAFAVMLRGIILGTINLKNGVPALWQETKAAVYNGVMIGVIVALISVIWNGSWLLGLVVGLSLLGVHLVAGFMGAFLPLLLKHLGFDPAATTTIFITTATDIFGLFFLLGLGALILL